MVRLISRQRGGLAALKLTKLFGIDDFPAAKDAGKVLIIIIYCYLFNYYYLKKTTWNHPLQSLDFIFDVLIFIMKTCLCQWLKTTRPAGTLIRNC